MKSKFAVHGWFKVKNILILLKYSGGAYQILAQWANLAKDTNNTFPRPHCWNFSTEPLPLNDRAKGFYAVAPPSQKNILGVLDKMA